MRIPMLPLALAMLATAFSGAAGATTWNEPWHEDVVRRSDTFGLYQVVSVDGQKARVKLLRHVSGLETPPELLLSGYTLLRKTSSHGDGDSETHPWLEPGKSYYLFLSRDDLEAWHLATPSAGSGMVREGGIVEATYRISMHQALVPKADYELTQDCIFQSLHGKSCDTAKLRAFMDSKVRQPVAELSPSTGEAEANRFFLQHAALETAALVHAEVPAEALKRFEQSHFFHVEFSTLRYLSMSSLPDKWERIGRFACDGQRHEFPRRYALLLLERGDARSQAPTLRACLGRAPTEGEGSLVGSIMDPRVGTHFPENVKKGIDELLAKWEAPRPKAATARAE